MLSTNLLLMLPKQFSHVITTVEEVDNNVIIGMYGDTMNVLLGQ